MELPHHRWYTPPSSGRVWKPSKTLGNGHARGTLRYNINFANNNPGPDTIDFKVTGAIQLMSQLPG